MEQVDDSIRRPYSSICQLRMDFLKSPSEARGLHRGTGCFIRSNILLTAAHNILHPIYGQAETIEVVIGRRVVTLRNKKIDGPFYIPERWRAQVYQGLVSFSPFDYGIIRLPNHYDLGIFRMRPSIPKDIKVVTVSGFRSATVVGTPEILLRRTGKLHYGVNNNPNKPWRKLVYDINTDDGVSGGPIYYKVTKPSLLYHQIGIHSGQPRNKPYAYGVKITQLVFEDIEDNI